MPCDGRNIKKQGDGYAPFRQQERQWLRNGACSHLGIGGTLLASLGVGQLLVALRGGMAQLVRKAALLREQQGQHQHEKAKTAFKHL